MHPKPSSTPGSAVKRHVVLAESLLIGHPLPWDLYGDGGLLLLSKGHIVTDSLVDKFSERALYTIDAAHPALRNAHEALVPELPSATKMLDTVGLRLRDLLFEIEAVARAATRGQLVVPETFMVHEKVFDVVGLVEMATSLSSSVALARILHNQHGAYSVRHSIDVAVVALCVARALKKPTAEIRSLVAAALTMNIGMLHQHDRLQGASLAVSSADADIIRQHPHIGAELLAAAGVHDQDWLSYVRMHHENENGSGYPIGHHGADILEGTKILAIADRYCARISARNYRKSFLPTAALRDILLTEKDTISREVAAQFIHVLGTYPVGTFVRIENGEICVVTSAGAGATTPKVHAIIGSRGVPLDAIMERDTATQLCAIRDVVSHEALGVQVDFAQIWGSLGAR
ncbi:MAG: HD domain-containing phosphohydrolase [Pseudomonadota bacterium]